MWRALFLAMGLFTLILGIESFVIDHAVLTNGQGDVLPPEWAPWSLMSAGAVIVLYSFTIPRRMSG